MLDDARKYGKRKAVLMPIVPTVPDRKRSPFDEKAQVSMVLKALIDATEHPTGQVFLLTKTPQNQLNQLYRHEIIAALERIAKTHRLIFVIKPSNYPKRIPVNPHSGGDTVYRQELLAEDQPIALVLTEGFQNWRAAYLHQQRIILADLKPLAFEKVYRTILAIDERFQLRSSPIVKIGWRPRSDDENAAAREDALLFLRNKNAVKNYDFYFSHLGEGSCINLEINVKEFEQIRDEAMRLFQERERAEQPSSTLPPTPVPRLATQDDKPFKHLKWEDISIQFLDGHNVRIAGKGISTTAHFKEMGFEDARSRNPDQQWELLKLLAASEGEFSWNNPEARDSIKKKKQLLSKTLREYFAIKSDPFYPYKEQASYRIKATLLPVK